MKGSMLTCRTKAGVKHILAERDLLSLRSNYLFVAEGDPLDRFKVGSMNTVRSLEGSSSGVSVPSWPTSEAGEVQNSRRFS